MFLLAIAGFWVLLLAIVVFFIAFIVCLVGFLRLKSRRKAKENAVTEEGLLAAKRNMIASGVLLLLMLAAELVCLYVFANAMTSM